MSVNRVAATLACIVLLVACAGAADPLMPSNLSSRASVAPAASATAAPSTTPAPSATPERAADAYDMGERSPAPQPSTPASAPASDDASTGASGQAAGRPAWQYPIRLAGRQPGDGLIIRHGFQTENIWYNPGYWHTGEDWYELGGNTAGADVLAVASGEVVYAGANYPGRVVIVRHAENLYGMYGHLDPALAVAEGQTVERGQILGTVLRRSDGVPDHLHFELRTFLTADPVNGPNPRYPFRCGPNCAPGPGYWPIAAPELPAALGWLNPTHAIAARTAAAPAAVGEVVVADPPATATTALWAELDENGTPTAQLGELALEAGTRYRVLETRAGPEQPAATGARAYSLLYRLALPDGRSAWVMALEPSANDTGSDGAPSSVRFNLVPVAESGG